MDKLQVLQKLAADEKKSARIFKALADPPTTSLQRLKVMSTAVCLFILSALQMLCQKKLLSLANLNAIQNGCVLNA
jgi:hypothetical protein